MRRCQRSKTGCDAETEGVGRVCTLSPSMRLNGQFGLPAGPLRCARLQRLPLAVRREPVLVGACPGARSAPADTPSPQERRVVLGASPDHDRPASLPSGPPSMPRGPVYGHADDRRRTPSPPRLLLLPEGWVTPGHSLGGSCRLLVARRLPDAARRTWLTRRGSWQHPRYEAASPMPLWTPSPECCLRGRWAVGGDPSPAGDPDLLEAPKKFFGLN